MSVEREILASIELGEDALAFLQSPLGKTLLGMARQEVTAAVDDMLAADPEDKKVMRAIQLKMLLGARFEDWLHYLVLQGQQSMETLNKPGVD